MDYFKGGSCLVANEVIDKIIAYAATQVEGVAEVPGYDQDSGKLRYRHEKYLASEEENGHLWIALMIVVDRDYSVMEVVKNVQKSIKEEVESMLGLVCEKIDVAVL